MSPSATEFLENIGADTMDPIVSGLAAIQEEIEAGISLGKPPVEEEKSPEASSPESPKGEEIDLRPVVPIRDDAKPIIGSVIHVLQIERRYIQNTIHYIGVTGYKTSDMDIGYQFMIVPESSMREKGWWFNAFVVTPGEEIVVYMQPIGEANLDVRLQVRLVVVQLASIPSTFKKE